MLLRPLAVVALAGTLATLSPATYRVLGVANAYLAKNLCSAVYVSRREAEAAIREENLVQIPLTRWHVDERTRSVTASYFGLAARRASYRPGRGCSLHHDRAVRTAPERRPLGMRRSATPRAPARRANEGQLIVQPGSEALEMAIASAFAETDADGPVRTWAVVVMQGGRIVGERYAPEVEPDTPLLGYSMTKSVTGTLAGILVGEGKLALHEPVSLPEWRVPGDPRAEITLEHLLQMSTGLAFDEDYVNPLADVTVMLYESRDAARFASQKPLAAPVGSMWSYSSGTTNVLARVLRRAIGSDAAYVRFPREALFAPVGMDSAVIELDPAGNLVGSTFMYATARDWARFGQLHLNDGVWDGKRILPPGWVEYVRTPAPRAPMGRYGAQFWLNRGADDASPPPFPLVPRDAYFALGHFSQSVTIVPSRDAVIVRLGHTEDSTHFRHDRFAADVLAALPSS
jgi:hypothetical protein